MSITRMLILAASIIIFIITLGYLIWWAVRFINLIRARRLATTTNKPGDWTPGFQEQLLNFTRVLSPLSQEYGWICLALAQHGIMEPRAQALYERYLAVQRITPENALVARSVAYGLLGTTSTTTLQVDKLPPTDAYNAAALLDRLGELHLATQDDIKLRAIFASQWIDVSSQAINACMDAWHLLKDTSDVSILTRFLYDYFLAAWESRAERSLDDPAEASSTDQTHQFFIASAAEVFRYMADIPPANLTTRHYAIQATFENGDYLACFDQCERARDEFGAPALNDEIWKYWGQCIVKLEGDNPQFGEHQFTRLPQRLSWNRLQEILDRATAILPEDVPLLHAKALVYVGLKLPVLRALPVYERVLSYQLPIPSALKTLAEYYHANRNWPDLERACRVLLSLQDQTSIKQTIKWLAEALIEGGGKPDISIFEQAFDLEPGYLAMNEQLALYYLEKPNLSGHDLGYLGRLLDTPLPATFPKVKLLELREKYALTWLDNGEQPTEGLSIQVGRYLEMGGSNPRLMAWAVDANIGNLNRKQANLEALIRLRPVERRYCLELAKLYETVKPTRKQVSHLAEAAESIWEEKSSFDAEDCRLAQMIGEHQELTPVTRRKLLVSLLTLQPSGCHDTVENYLGISLEKEQVDPELLQLVLTQFYKPDDHEPLHAWTLEAIHTHRNEPIKDSLRLLSLYDSGIARPGENAEKAHEKGEKLAQGLAERCRKAGPQLRSDLFTPLLDRITAKSVNTIAEWELGFIFDGIKEGLTTDTRENVQFAKELAKLLLNKKDPRAVTIQRWIYEHSKRTPADAARLLSMANQLKQIKPGDPFWFEVARSASSEEGVSTQAKDHLVESLLAESKWDKHQVDTVYELLDSDFRSRLAPAFIDRVEYGHDHKLDRKMLELLNENPDWGKGRADILLALAERRERKNDFDGALEACLMVEESVGSSEELARRVLSLLPNSSQRIQQAGRVAEYLKLYRNSFDLLAQMVALARDPSRPLSFDLAYSIVDRWGDLAAKQDPSQVSYASDPSFVVTTKCEVYDLFREEMLPQDAQAMLRSIAKHSRQALSDEAHKRVERIGDEVLFSSGQDNETRQIVAEILYGLGNLPAATYHFEKLSEVQDYRKNAIESLERIARQLESPQRELPALLTTYRCVANNAYENGLLDVAEATAKKAKLILLDETALEELSEEDRRRISLQRDAILKLHQTILENTQAKGALSPEQMRDLADVFRLRALWDKAGRLYSELALNLTRKNDREGALECADLVFDCYYKGGKGWWDPGARFLLRILWGRENVPPSDIADNFNKHEFSLMESVGVLYHSLCVDPNLRLDPARRMQYKRNAIQLYERLSLAYVQEHEYINKLSFDLSQVTPTILEPFDYVPHIREHGRVEVWTGTRYERQDRLGGGEFAEVFRVLDTQTGQTYAMKLITPAKGRDPKALERFQREGTWLKEIDHPNIVKCYDAGVQEDRQFIIMDYVEGQTLDDLIARRRREIPIQQRLRIFLGICSAAEFLHSQGILHRDLHPGNVMIGGKDLELVKLTDFGLATMMDREGVGKSSRIHGRENYTPPEVYAGRGETTASEIYSLGAMLCFILTGWPRPDAALLRELKSPEFYNLGEVIERCLSNDLNVRYQHVTELIQEVRQRAEVPYDYGAILQKVTPLRFQQMFELGPVLGEGDAGKVYRARDLRMPDAPDVAIKEIASERVRGSLERRAEHFFRVRDLSHPNLVRLQAFFRVDTKLYVVMDLVQGSSLSNLMDANVSQGIRFSLTESMRTVTDVAQGLAFVHKNGIVHGCIVPTNILVEETSKVTKLSDFAASVLFEGDQWHKSAMVRQYNYYLAPEIANNSTVTPSSDVYSLGWLLCQLLTGQRGQLSSTEIYAALEEMGSCEEAQMDRLVVLIEGCTALDPARRTYPDANAFLEAVKEIRKPGS